MKRLFIIIVLFVFGLSAISIFDNSDFKSYDKVIKEVKEDKKKEKDNFIYLTNSNDNIDDLLKERFVVEEKVKYICEKTGFITKDNKTYYVEDGNIVKGLKLINNQRYYFDFETGELLKENVKSVIDISSWQEDIDFELLKESNLIDYVIVRLGYGTNNNESPILDNKFERNINELNRLNIPYGIYFYGYASTIESSTLEANFTIDMIKKYNVNLSLPIFYDAELKELNNIIYTNEIYNDVINNYIKVLNNNGYYDVGVYSNLNMFLNGSLNTLDKKIPRWISEYYYRCEYPDEYIGWQYTNSFKIPGVNQMVDMNIFY